MRIPRGAVGRCSNFINCMRKELDPKKLSLHLMGMKRWQLTQSYDCDMNKLKAVFFWSRVACWASRLLQYLKCFVKVNSNPALHVAYAAKRGSTTRPSPPRSCMTLVHTYFPCGASLYWVTGQAHFAQVKYCGDIKIWYSPIPICIFRLGPTYLCGFQRRQLNRFWYGEQAVTDLTMLRYILVPFPWVHNLFSNPNSSSPK